jgi:hypothetical protein
MFRFIPSLTGLITRRSSALMIHRLASRSSTSGSQEEPRVRLHPGHQFTLEEIAQGIPEQRKGEIEQLYEFEKLEINNQPTARDAYRHHTNRESFGDICLLSSARFCLLGGKEGVFDLEDILQILRDERMRDICVIEIPPEQQYAHYLILATAFSARHLQSVSEYINKLVSDPERSRCVAKTNNNTFGLFSTRRRRDPAIRI